VTIEPTEFDMIALARRGLQAHLDEAIAEVKVARTYEAWDPGTGQLTPASEEAKAKVEPAGVTSDRAGRRRRGAGRPSILNVRSFSRAHRGRPCA